MPIVAVFKKLLKEVTWERVINKVFYTGRLRPEVQPLTVPFFIPFLKRYPFRVPFTDKLYPISCPPFNCCKCNVLNMKKTTERFLDLYTTGADYQSTDIKGIC